MLYHAGFAAVAAALLLSTPVLADWSESFGGGTADQEWELFVIETDDDEFDVPEWPIEHSGSVYGELRDPNGVTLPDPETIEQAYGAVDEVYTDATISAWVNLAPPEPGNHTIIGLLLRADREQGRAYAFGYALLDGVWGILKFTDDDDGLSSLIASDTDGDLDTDNLPTDQPLYLVFDVTGNVLTGQVFDAPDGNLLGEMTTTDDMFDSGVAGVFAQLEDDAPDGQQIIASFDDINASGIPEPTSIALLAVGGAATLRRRR